MPGDGVVLRNSFSRSDVRYPFVIDTPPSPEAVGAYRVQCKPGPGSQKPCLAGSSQSQHRKQQARSK